MKILGYIGTYNEKVDRPLQALLDQSYPVNDILVVDNASTEHVLPKELPEQVTVIRNEKNLGPSGAVAAGLQYALKHGYDWIWLFDSDSAPHKDSLEKLVDLYESFDLETRNHIGTLVCSQVLLPSSRLFQGRLLTPGGPRLPKIDPHLPFCESDISLWSGSLFNLKAVREVGFPRYGKTAYWEDFGHDYGDTEYHYRIKRAGYKVFVHRFSIVDTTIGLSKCTHILGRPFISTNHPPHRRHLIFRNTIFFWLYVYPRINWPRFIVWFMYRFTVTIIGILFMEENRVRKILACFRGVWDGITKKLYRMY